MIIGIDETGDFDPNSKYKQFITAVAVDQNANKYQIKQRQFLEWETSIPEENKDPKSGELKGRFLSPQQIHEFFFKVLMAEPPAYFTIVEFDPKENTRDTVEKHKQWNISQMTNSMAERKNANHTNWAKRWGELITWYSKSNYQRVVKIQSLQDLYFTAFHQAFYYAQLLFLKDNGDDSNFKFQIKIDKDFVRSPLLRNFWDIHSYKKWQVFSQSDKPIVLGDNVQIMEVLQRHFELIGPVIKFVEPFYEKTTFVDSKDHFEVRLADILGNILHRFHNKGQCKEIWRFILYVLSQERTVPVYSKVSFDNSNPSEG